MSAIYLILLILAAICFLVAALRLAVRGIDPPVGRTIDLVALGLFFWVLVELLRQLDRTL